MKHKKVGIYNRWLSTLGGGEVMTLGFFEYFKSKHYAVKLITPWAIDVSVINQRFNTNLAAEDIVITHTSESSAISELSREYDVFLNISHFDYVENFSQQGILCVYFPAQLHGSLPETLKRQILIPMIQQSLLYVDHSAVICSDSETAWHWYLNQRLPAGYISLQYSKVSTSLLEQTYQHLKNTHQVSSGAISFQHQNNTLIISLAQDSTHFSLSLPTELTTHLQTVQIIIDDLRSSAHQLFKKYFPILELRLHGGPGPFGNKQLNSYQHIFAISAFTQLWIQRYWHNSSQILYPPTELLQPQSWQQKKNWICHVGRFFATGHNKQQLEMIKAFKKIVAQGTPDWEFHLVGAAGEESIHQDYVRRCQNEAKGYPIFFHLNATTEQRNKVLRSAKLYWHATGMSIDPDRQPAYLEHFGISVVEAMSAGTVPVVIDRGGLPEIVSPETGEVWQTESELLSTTERLIHDQDQLAKKSRSAVLASQRFSKQAFWQQLDKLFQEEKN